LNVPEEKVGAEGEGRISLRRLCLSEGSEKRVSAR